jgi:hypothetical protein
MAKTSPGLLHSHYYILDGKEPVCMGGWGGDNGHTEVWNTAYTTGGTTEVGQTVSKIRQIKQTTLYRTLHILGL